MTSADFEIFSKLSAFKNFILHNNRFFVSNDNFLIELKKYIQQDLRSIEPIMISVIPKDSILYRARIMDESLKNDKYFVTEMMDNYGSEIDSFMRCNKCRKIMTCNSSCKVASTDKAENFKQSAKDNYLRIAPDLKPNFNGFNKQDSSIPPYNKSNHITDGRVNPKYIRYLYVANDKYTAMLETRANIGSLVSVASIKILEHLQILDITNPKRFET